VLSRYWSNLEAIDPAMEESSLLEKDPPPGVKDPRFCEGTGMLAVAGGALATDGAWSKGPRAETEWAVSTVFIILVGLRLSQSSRCWKERGVRMTWRRRKASWKRKGWIFGGRKEAGKRKEEEGRGRKRNEDEDERNEDEERGMRKGDGLSSAHSLSISHCRCQRGDGHPCINTDKQNRTDQRTRLQQLTLPDYSIVSAAANHRAHTRQQPASVQL